MKITITLQATEDLQRDCDGQGHKGGGDGVAAVVEELAKHRCGAGAASLYHAA